MAAGPGPSALARHNALESGGGQHKMTVNKLDIVNKREDHQKSHRPTRSSTCQGFTVADRHRALKSDKGRVEDEVAIPL